MTDKICRKCLLEEEERKYRKNLSDYASRIDDDIRTEENEYQRRLAGCRRCEKYRDGLCMMCGCFVEMRAAVRTRKCPKVQPEW